MDEFSIKESVQPADGFGNKNSDCFKMESDILNVSDFAMKRKVFYDIKRFIETSSKNVCFLLGPRKVGKTFCLGQLMNEYRNVKYFDFKQHSDAENEKIITYLETQLAEGIVFLDEITYLDQADLFLARLSALLLGKTTNVKIVITGSQMETLIQWKNTAFCTNADIIHCSYLDFEEWLLYKGTIKQYGDHATCVNEEYYDYILHSSEFFGLMDNEEYLAGCIDEVLNSEYKSCNVVRMLEDISSEDLEDLSAMLYMSFVKLHNAWSRNSWEKRSTIPRTILKSYGGTLNKENLYEHILNEFERKFSYLKTMQIDKLRKYLRFLIKCDMIVLVIDSAEDTNTVRDWLFGRCDLYSNANELFKHINPCIKHPIFYANILRELTQGCIEEYMDKSLLGSILECNVRGVYSYISQDYLSPEFHSDDGSEVDIFDSVNKIAIEISVSDKNKRDVHFDRIPDYQDVDLFLFTATRNIENELLHAAPYGEMLLHFIRQVTKWKVR